MRVSANSLPAWIWLDIIEYLDMMDDTISLAMVNEYFYRIVGMDFKKICYEYVICRQKGETWAYAYKNASTNLNKTMYAKNNFHDEHAVCCPFTGKVAIKLDHGYVILTNIDFGLKEFTILDFTSYTDQITHVNMINRGKELLVRTPFFTLVYDLCIMKVIQKHDMAPTHAYGPYCPSLNFQIVREGYVFDLYSKKEFKIDAQPPKGCIKYSNMFDKSKYVVVHTTDNNLVVIDSETDKRHDICEWRQGMEVYVINENDSLFIKDQFYNDRELKIQRAKCEIYSMKRQTFQPVESVEGYYWGIFNSSTLFNRKTQKFLVYNKHNYEWIQVQAKPELLFFYRWIEFGLFLYPLSPFNMVLCKYGNFDTLARNSFIQFKKNDVRIKHFKAIVNHWHMSRGLKDFKIQTEHQIEKLMKMKFPVPKEASADFYDWFVQLHIANDNVPLIDAKTSATEYFNFYSLKPQ
ncbi:unnamed protein product [Bursaphelenchus okinawaensis]|uniref:F-box domain-containing protein n=1 Tax=Bursaphelenchus okinawaensis TaxID=465554 RepID=A0A811LT13_9BILA|nr:unnamed protein product [Bursaphelenchus okinawaensis]CAG9128549.1 unnamed protein product [Bursaphelenchus okinawaensis]